VFSCDSLRIFISEGFASAAGPFQCSALWFGSLEAWRLGVLKAWRLGGLEARWLAMAWSCGALGICLGCSWSALTMLRGSLGRILEPLGVLLGCLLLLLGCSCDASGSLGASWDALGVPLGVLKVLLGAIIENLYGEEGALKCSWVPKRENQPKTTGFISKI
jgi:hypothetical protein